MSTSARFPAQVPSGSNSSSSSTCAASGAVRVFQSTQSGSWSGTVDMWVASPSGVLLQGTRVQLHITLELSGTSATVYFSSEHDKLGPKDLQVGWGLAPAASLPARPASAAGC
jgi:hypothetical protein